MAMDEGSFVIGGMLIIAGIFLFGVAGCQFIEEAERKENLKTVTCEMVGTEGSSAQDCLDRAIANENEKLGSHDNG